MVEYYFEKNGLKDSEFAGNIGLIGVCFGLTVVTDLVQAGAMKATLGDFSQVDRWCDVGPYDNIVVDSIMRMTLLDYIKYNHMYQFYDAIDSKLVEHNFDFSGLIEAIDKYKNGSSKWMPILWLEVQKENKSDEDESHAILAYDYLIEEDCEKLTLYVYDPNDPFSVFNGAKPNNIEISNYKTKPAWIYRLVNGYSGNKEDAIKYGSKFSWLLPEWNCFESKRKKYKFISEVTFKQFIDRYGQVLQNIANGITGKANGISVINDGSSTGTLTAWFTPNDTIQLEDVDLSLYGDDYNYKITGAKDLSVEFTNDREVKTITMNGGEGASIEYTYSTKSGDVTTKKTVNEGEEITVANDKKPLVTPDVPSTPTTPSTTPTTPSKQDTPASPVVTKKSNPLTITTKKVNVKSSKLKKKAVKIAAKKVFNVKGAKGAVTYKKVTGNKKIKVGKSGRLTIKKGLKKGKYSLWVRVTAAGDKEYDPANQSVAVTVVVK